MFSSTSYPRKGSPWQSSPATLDISNCLGPGCPNRCRYGYLEEKTGWKLLQQQYLCSSTTYRLGGVRLGVWSDGKAGPCMGVVWVLVHVHALDQGRA